MTYKAQCSISINVIDVKVLYLIKYLYADNLLITLFLTHIVVEPVDILAVISMLRLILKTN